MSYILDALRRAEADRERERGQVPGLHTQTLTGTEGAQAASRRRWLPWAGGGLLLLGGLVAGSWWASSPQEPPATPPRPAAAPLAAPAPPPAVTAAATPSLAAPPAPVAASGSPYLPPAPPPGSVTAAVPPPQPAPAPEAEARIPRLAELPESLRQSLPKLAISGSVYSESPASRFLIVNGDVQREGATLAPDLVLEEIRPHELVLRFKGQRYRQPI